MRILLIIQYLFIILNFLFAIEKQNNFENISDVIIPEIYIKSCDRDDKIDFSSSVDDYILYNWKDLKTDKDIKKIKFLLKSNFIINDNLKDNQISLYLGPSGYAMNIYLNSILIDKRGDQFVNNAFYGAKNILLSNDLLKYSLKNKKNINTIILEILPSKELSPVSTFKISSYRKNAKLVFFRTFFSVNLVQGTFILSIIIFLYFIFLFIALKFQDKRYIYFAFLSLFYALSYINMTFNYESINETLMEMISRSSLSFAVLFLSYFTIEYVQILNKKKYFKLILSMPAILFAIIIFLQETRDDVNTIFSIPTNFYIPPLLIFIIVLIIISIVKEKKIGSIIILISMSILIISSIHDIICISIPYIPYLYLVPYSYFLLIISIFFILSIEQSRIYTKSLIINDELNKKNKYLKEIFDNISEISDSLIRISSSLAESSNNAYNIILEFQQNNNKINENIKKQFNEIQKNISDVEKDILSSIETINNSIGNQTSVVEEVNATIINMSNNFEKIFISSKESSNFANRLADIASSSKKIIIESKESIERIKEHSNFINDVLYSIEDITAKTNLLSINASIEAARAGESGKGFSIVANEVRNLSTQSKKSLDSSFNKIKEMSSIIEQSISLSEKVYSGLLNIISDSTTSASMIKNINFLIDNEKEETKAIIEAMKSLLKDTIQIKELTENELDQNEKIKNILNEFNKSFSQIINLLNEQTNKSLFLINFIDNIKSIINENNMNIKKLENYIIKLKK